MVVPQADVIVAGHICLDVIPTFSGPSGGLERLLVPGKLTTVGPAVVATGGAVSNTGLALHRLGVRTKLMGKIGDDLFGRAILDFVGGHDPALAAGMIVGSDPSAYTLIINPPDVDRVFLHYPGANDTFGAEDVDVEQVRGARVFHFGYPPIMRRFHIDGGGELAALLARVRAAGVTTSLDMSLPDPDSSAGRVDWPALLAQALPHTDLFLPSVEEMVFMLMRRRLDDLRSGRLEVDGALLAELGGRLIDMGAAVALIKLGDQGAYLRTSGDQARLAAIGPAAPAGLDDWTGRELLAPCFRVDVAGTTGAGDCTIAGFLAALLRGAGPEEAMTSAVAVGACNVERADATSGVPHWREVQSRVEAGWARRPVTLALPLWRRDSSTGLYHGPQDRMNSRQNSEQHRA